MPRRTRPPVQARRRLFPACSVKNLLRTRSPRLDAYCRWPQHGLRSGSPLSLHCSPRESADVFTQIGVFFSKMAVVTFGRAYAVLAYVAQQAVEIHGWLKPGKMLDGLGMAETTPGPLIMGALAATAARRHIRRIAGDLGNVHAVLSLDLCRRAVHRKSARQQGTERRVFRDH